MVEKVIITGDQKGCSALEKIVMSKSKEDTVDESMVNDPISEIEPTESTLPVMRLQR